MRKPLVLLASLTVLFGAAHGATITNTFDGSQAPPIGAPGPNAPSVPTVADGIHALGITFGFTEGGVSSTNALYGRDIDTVNNELAPLSDPVLDGPATGVLTFDFDMPANFLAFDIAFGVLPENSGGIVTIGTTSIPFTTIGNSGFMGFFSLGSFSYTASSSFTNAVITFDSNASSANFAIDNLSYDAILASSAVGVPEP